MTTPKQLAANRRNALKSTGPQTEHGKNISRLNALRHGAFAEHLALLPGENPDDLAALRRAYRDLYRPANQTEYFLVDRMILSAWRLMRLTMLEPRVVQVHHETGEHASANMHEIISMFRKLILPDNPHFRSQAEAATPTYADPVAHAYVRDSEHGNTVSKIARQQIALERSFDRAHHELRALRKKS